MVSAGISSDHISDHISNFLTPNIVSTNKHHQLNTLAIKSNHERQGEARVGKPTF